MKKNLLVYFIIIATVIVAWFILERTQLFQDEQITNNEKIKVATTIYPLSDIVKNIGQEKVEVVQILPSGASVHSYEPEVSDVRKISDSKAVFYIGHGLDNWILSLAESAGVEETIKTDKYVNLLEGEDHHHEDEHEGEEHGEDPHYWLSLENGEKIARQVAEKLALIDVANEDYYMNNLDKYIDDMRVSRIYLDSLVEDIENRKILVYHNSWQYLSKDFNFEVVGALKTSDAHDQGPRHLEELYETVARENIKTIYGEVQFSTDQIKPLAQDLDLQIIRLDPLGARDEIDSYIKLIEYNVLQIYEGQGARN
ncbi:MAG: metal ABC transporter substrate-binding protein [Parcubacteria group bacterium]